jgi:hypothetical protein
MLGLFYICSRMPEESKKHLILQSAPFMPIALDEMPF